MTKMRIIISGGGTGGHIFPAISIANAIREMNPDADILFVGAEGKMEMEKVPAAGYRIVGLPVAGLQRSLTPRNLLLPFKLLSSLHKAGRIVRSFKPDVAVGVGGYASAPVLWSASHHGVPCLIQEQNSYAGLTNKILSRKASVICTAYEGMERFFPKERIILTGNPIRKEIVPPTAEDRAEGYRFYGLDPGKKTVFVVGGSLGCRTLNETMKEWIANKGGEKPYQVIWQYGKLYRNGVKTFLEGRKPANVYCTDFIKRMDLAYAVADLIVSRAGAGTISELCVAGKATLFVPSPVVAEDHQTHNAMALVEKGAARMVKDCDAKEKLFDETEKILFSDDELKSLENNILKLGKKDAAAQIAAEVMKLSGK